MSLFQLRAKVRAKCFASKPRPYDMSQLHDGQCGLCAHFGENHQGPHQIDLTQIRASHQADDKLLDDCGHPKHAPLHLKVSPISGCDGFQPARA
jgi:hypothetical protein